MVLPAGNPDVLAALARSSMGIFRDHVNSRLAIRKRLRGKDLQSLASRSQRLAPGIQHGMATPGKGKDITTKRRKVEEPAPVKASPPYSSSARPLAPSPAGHDLGGSWETIQPAATSTMLHDFAQLFPATQSSLSQHSVPADGHHPWDPNKSVISFPQLSSTPGPGSTNVNANAGSPLWWCHTCQGWPCTCPPFSWSF